MKQRPTCNIIAPMIGILLTSIIFLAVFSNSFIQSFIFNSDQLTIPSLAEDIFTNPNFSIFTWMVPRAPYFFPDLPVYLFIRLLTDNSFVAVYIIGYWHILVISLAAFAVARHTMSDKSSANIAWLSFLVVCLLVIAVASLGQNAPLLLHPFIPIAHGTAAVSAILAFVGYDRFVAKGGPKARLFAILIFAVAIFSDKLFAVYFYIPYALSVIFTSAASKSIYRIVVLIAEGTISLVIALVAESAITQQVMDPIELTPIARFKSIGHIFIQWPAASITLFLCVLPALIAPARALYMRDNRSTLSPANMQARIFLSALTICGLGVGILLWRDATPAYSRYLVGMQLGGMLLAAVLLADSISHRRSLMSGLIGLGAIACVSATLLNPFGSLKTPLLEKQKSAQAFNACYTKLELKTGLAPYWIARRLSGITDWKVHINQLEPAYPRPFYWGSNLLWFYYNMKIDAPTTTNFIISNGMKRSDIEQYFGSPSRESDCGDFHFLVYDQPRGLDRRVSQILGQITNTGSEETHFPASFGVDRYLGQIDLLTMKQQTGRFVGGSAATASPTDPPGFLLYGPYISLARNSYLIEMEYSCESGTKPSTIDVTADLGKVVLNSETFVPGDSRCDGTTKRLALPFTAESRLRNVEFRLAYGGTGLFQVSSMTLSLSAPLTQGPTKN